MARRTVSKEGPHPVDVHVGQRVRERRKALGMSQNDLGNALGLTFQQVQKNERGVNRIGASRLNELSEILNVPVSFFFDGIHVPSEAGIAPAAARGNTADDVMAQRETLDLIRAYYRLEDSALRRRVYELVKTLAKTSEV